MEMTGAKILMECLLEQGVDLVFGYPGGTILNVYDELYRYKDRITHILTAHEQGASHAADGYARSTGKVGVCLATSGPGATNLTTGIATAYMDSSPVVFITCNVTQNLIGRDAFQEVDITGIAMPITKCTYLVRDVNTLADIVREAFAIARSGRPGPVLIDIVKNVTAEKADYEYLPREKHTSSGRLAKLVQRARTSSLKMPEPNQEDVNKLVDMIAQSKKPMLICGGGVVRSRSHKEFQEFARRLDAPVAITLMGAGGIPGRDPLSTGMIGMHGTVSAAWAVERCDLLVCIGARFSDRVATNTKRFAPSAKVIHVDIDNAEINKNIGVDYAIVSDAETFLEKVMPYIKEAKHDAWRAQITEWQTKLDYVPKDDESVIHPHQLLRTVAEETPEDTIIATDVGQHQLWSAQYNGRKHVRQFLTSGGLGTMGFGYGAALGAQVAFPDRTVVHITGDGSFHMNLNEICTAVSYNLPVITIIMNNRVLGNVRQWQTMFYDKHYAATTPHRKTDFVKLAEAFGARGVRCTNLAEFSDALREAMKRTGPVLIDAQIDKDERVLPMIPAGGTVDDLVTE